VSPRSDRTAGATVLALFLPPFLAALFARLLVAGRPELPHGVAQQRFEAL
jgi:hypothetical protein